MAERHRLLGGEAVHGPPPRASGGLSLPAMEWLQVAVLALVQGLTEFLPVSSSAHLILVPVLTGWPDQGLSFDVAVHVGSLAAVLAYFRDDVRAMTVAWLGSVRGRGAGADARLAWAVLIATLPAALAGLATRDVVAAYLRGPLVIATATVLFGLLLWYADRAGARARDERTLRWRDVLLIGLMQALALIPGTSRAGITITAGLLLGLTRAAAARFSFLLAIPIVALSGLGTGYDLARAPEAVDWRMLVAATLLSAASAYACIHYFLRWLERMSLLVFVLYRLALGALLFAWFW